MRSLHRISAALYLEPWLITSSRHMALHQQLQSALRTPKPALRALGWEDDDDDENPSSALRNPQCNMDCLADIEISNGLAIVPVCGVLGKHLDIMETLCGGYDLALLQQQCLALMNRADVETVLFSFNTPGGRVAGTEDTAQIIRQLSETKTTVAWCDDACSAGYWLAAACDRIICGASSTIGSIGTVCAVLDESKAYEAEGMKMDVFTDGALKGSGIEGTSLTAAQRADIQARVDRLGARFKNFITERRGKIAPDTMQGQFFYGEHAIELGLVDELLPSIEYACASLL